MAALVVPSESTGEGGEAFPQRFIGYSCGVLFVYHRVTTARLASTHLIFIPGHKSQRLEKEFWGFFVVFFLLHCLLATEHNLS